MSVELQYYQPPQASLWQGRDDGLRLHQCVTTQSIDEPVKTEGVSMIGFCSDIGVARNLGRIGAKDGPHALRQSMRNLTIAHDLKLTDVGDIKPIEDLEAGQKALGQAVQTLQAQHQVTVVLGGGHETAWGHFQGLKSQPFADDLAIINFDAHFDLRQANHSTSGTPFRQIFEACEFNGIPFQYYCFGIQPQANTQTLFDTAKQTNTQYWTAQQIHQNPTTLYEAIDHILNKHKAVYVTVCLDAINMAFAPGVSAPSPLGLMPWHMELALTQCGRANKVKAFDCVELAPNLDNQEMTAKLGAQLIGTFLAAQG